MFWSFVPNSFQSTPSQNGKYLSNITSYSWFNIIIEAGKNNYDSIHHKGIQQKTKAMWQLINREISKTQEDDYKFELKIGNNIILNPNEITEKN